jgi:hypothetical protein
MTPIPGLLRNDEARRAPLATSAHEVPLKQREPPSRRLSKGESGLREPRCQKPLDPTFLDARARSHRWGATKSMLKRISFLRPGSYA